jgi:cell division transport system permease protein
MLKFWFRHHCRALLEACSSLALKPFSSITTLLALGISMALPLALCLLVNNLSQLTPLIPNDPSFSLFLKKDLSPKQTKDFLEELKRDPHIEKSTYLSPEAALAELSTQNEFKLLVGSLPENPLPGVVIVYPKQRDHSFQLQDFEAQFRAHKAVDLFLMDIDWLLKLQGWLSIAQQLSVGFTLLLAIGVMLLIANSIRLALVDHQIEIRVFSLIGSSNSFIRRPFLYRGALFGLSGACLASFLILLCFSILETDLSNLLDLYEHSFKISGLKNTWIFFTLALGTVLGWLAAFVVVQPELKRVSKVELQ